MRLIQSIAKHQQFEFKSLELKKLSDRKACEDFVRYLAVDLSVKPSQIGRQLGIHINKVMEFLHGPKNNKQERMQHLKNKLAYHRLLLAKTNEKEVQEVSEFEENQRAQNHERNLIKQTKRLIYQLQHNHPSHGDEITPFIIHGKSQSRNNNLNN